MNYQIEVWQGKEKKVVKGKAGDNLLHLLQENGYEIASPCGGAGSCGKCKVKVLSPSKELSVEEKELLSSKELANNMRLACKINLESDLKIELVAEEKIEVLTSGLQKNLELDPLITKQVIKLEKPSITDQKPFLERVLSIFPGERIDLDFLKQLDNLDKEKELTLTIKDKEILQIEEGDKSQSLYGIAVDIGTTTIALYLMDLVSGKELDVFSLHNPQKRFGADVISRVNYTMENEKGIEELKKVLLKGLNQGIDKLVFNNNLQKDEILIMTIVGNTIMLHSLLGINAASIAHAPYIPVFTTTLELDPVKVGLNINKQGIVQLLPSVSGYVGADITGDMLAADFKSQDWNLLIDIGTNGEIVLGNNQKVLACSAAAGPAFEGAKITYGMAGVPGAISEYTLKEGKVDYQVIGEQKAKGICGSGIVDIIAELLNNKLLEPMGSFKAEEELTKEEEKLFVEYKGLRAFKVLAAQETGIEEDILLTQKDIREFQLANGAIVAGIKILLKEAGIVYNDLKNVFLAGGFGNYIKPENACRIGLIPAELEEKIVRIGNGAGLGAKMYLLSHKLKFSTAKLTTGVKYIELSSRSDFQNEFMEAMLFN